jgi:transposase
MWCVPHLDQEFIARMEDVLRLYARRLDPARPVVCLDEKPIVLHGSKRAGRRARPGQVARRDYEYRRLGTANVYCIVEPLTGRRLTHVTPHRGYREFTHALTRIARRYKRAKVIHLVLDNLSVHCAKACISTYGRRRGRALWRRFRVHFTPKHGSWLNAAEMEVSLLSRECLGRRRLIALDLVTNEVRVWSREADHARRPIRWSFKVSDARRKFRYSGITTPRSKD